jgi:hypothetical protein
MSKEAVKAQDIVVANIVFIPPEDNPRVKSQKIGFIRYKRDPKDQKDTTLKILTPEIITEAYGIPKEGKYYPDAASRAFYKFPFAHERRKYEGSMDYDAVESLYKKLKEIDAYCNTNNFRVQMFGDKMANKYQYQPIVRAPEEDEDNPTLRQQRESILSSSLHEDQARPQVHHDLPRLPRLREAGRRQEDGAAGHLRRRA